MNSPGLPPKQGLYDPGHEKDLYGIAFVGTPAIVKQEGPRIIEGG
jgi:hypothetical protein